VKGIKVYIKRTDGKIIPYEYNYYLSISLYSKLGYYQENVMKLHTKNQQGIHTFSNIISTVSKNAINGLDIENGFFIFRSVDSSLVDYLRMGFTLDPYIRVSEVTYKVTGIKDDVFLELSDSNFNFVSISPVLVRDFSAKNKFVNDGKNVDRNLTLISKWTLNNIYKLPLEKTENLKIELTSAKGKTVKISNSKKKESITTAFQIKGTITGSSEALKILYYKGLGSKTSLGLGCWRVLDGISSI
jgi:CRISPR-associated endoribonuclease Cas6